MKTKIRSNLVSRMRGNLLGLLGTRLKENYARGRVTSQEPRVTISSFQAAASSSKQIRV